jgi:hypothetical protein
LKFGTLPSASAGASRLIFSMSKNREPMTRKRPTVAAVTVTPNPAFEGDGTLTCAASGVADTDGDTVNLAYQWVVNSAVISGATTGTLSASNWRRDDVVVCTVTPSDSGTTGAPVSSIPLTLTDNGGTDESEVYFGDFDEAIIGELEKGTPSRYRRQDVSQIVRSAGHRLSEEHQRAMRSIRGIGYKLGTLKAYLLDKNR